MISFEYSQINENISEEEKSSDERLSGSYTLINSFVAIKLSNKNRFSFYSSKL